MKRFHVHVSVRDLDESLRFYATLFGAEPSVVKSDYAKWMLDDPRINFAISQRQEEVGINHLGLQTDSDAELAEIRERLQAGAQDGREESGAQCCYARSDKYWTQDPQGVIWENYHTLDSIPVYGKDAASVASGAACCAPEMKFEPLSNPQGKCCAPGAKLAREAGCC